MFHRDHMKKRILMALFGLVICAASVGLFKTALLGVDPFQSLLAGLDIVLPFGFGTVSLTVNLIVLLFALIADRHYLGLGTVFNMLLSGYIIEWVTGALRGIFPAPGLVLRAVFLLLGIVIMCFASAFYITADLGVSSYDSVALIISQTWGCWKFKYVRIVCDLVCVALGLTLYFASGGDLRGIGAIAGIGTIAAAFFMGPLIDLFRRCLSEPFLHNK